MSLRADWTQMGWRALRGAALLLTDPRGAAWRSKAPEDHMSAALRHITEWMAGDKLDRHTGKSHLLHAVCRVIMAAECEIAGGAR